MGEQEQPMMEREQAESEAAAGRSSRPGGVRRNRDGGEGTSSN